MFDLEAAKRRCEQESLSAQDIDRLALVYLPEALAEISRLRDTLTQLSEGHEADCRRRIRGTESRCNCSVGIARKALGLKP